MRKTSLSLAVLALASATALPAFAQAPSCRHNVGMVVSLQNLIVVTPSLPAKNLKEYIALATKEERLRKLGVLRPHRHAERPVIPRWRTRRIAGTSSAARSKSSRRSRKNRRPAKRRPVTPASAAICRRNSGRRAAGGRRADPQAPRRPRRLIHWIDRGRAGHLGLRLSLDR